MPNQSNSENSLPFLPPPLSRWKSPWSWVALLWVLGVVVPLLAIPLALLVPLLGLGLLFVYVAAMVAIALGVARWNPSFQVLVSLLLASVGIWALGQFIGIDNILEPLNRANVAARQAATIEQRLMGRLIRTTTDLALILAASFGGAMVAHLIKARNMLGPICAMIAMIDIWGVLFGGIVSQLMTNPATAGASQRAFAGPPPISGPRGVPPLQLPDIGAGDYLFLALLFTALVRLDMDWKSAARWVFPLVFFALLAIALGVPHLPGLLFIGLGVALPNLRFFQFTREEKFALIYAGIFVVILTVALYFGISSQLAPQSSKS